MQITCNISGESFNVSDHESRLRKSFDLDSLPEVSSKYRFKHIGAFWPMWNLHKRFCDKTGKQIISIFRPDCKYPIWDRSEWVEHANPPSREIDFSKSFFEQAGELFPKCPLPHNFQSHNQNCEYTDDWYYSKNCYLCHSGQNNEDCRYCYGCDSIKNVYFGVFSFESELCVDIINSSNCFSSIYLLSCKNVQDSYFLYDCRNCSDCLFCFNLRDKKYCFGNKQLTKEEFEKIRKKWDFSSISGYRKAKEFFTEMMKTSAWHRALQIDHCEKSSGNYIHHCKDCENCYMLSYHENCANVSFSGPNAKTCLDSLGTVGGEMSYYCSLPVYCYDARFCFSVTHSKFVEYSAYLQNCQYCFGCCGLVNEKYCIFNKKYPKEEYEELRSKLVNHMKQTGEWGQFFPGNFAPNPYDESYSGFHFPLTDEEKEKEGFGIVKPLEKFSVKTAEITDIPDSLKLLPPEKEKWLTEQIFWDEEYERPFQIQPADVEFFRNREVPLHRCYYINRIQENFRWMPFKGELRETTCARSGQTIQTNWPEEYDGKILSEEEYLKIVK